MFDLIRPRKVLEVRPLSQTAFVLRFERLHEVVRPGKHVDVGLPGSETRPYSLSSGEADPFLEILVRRVEGGRVSPHLSVLQPGDLVHVKAPKGKFTLDQARPGEKLLLVATGTGIAPFRSFVRSRPDLDYFLVHGAREPADDFGAEFAPEAHRVFCLSGAEGRPGAFRGRVTDWLRSVELTIYDRVYLCGNARMVVEAVPHLVDRGFDPDRIHTETYF